MLDPHKSVVPHYLLINPCYFINPCCLITRATSYYLLLALQIYTRVGEWGRRFSEYSFFLNELQVGVRVIRPGAGRHGAYSGRHSGMEPE